MYVFGEICVNNLASSKVKFNASFVVIRIVVFITKSINKTFFFLNQFLLTSKLSKVRPQITVKLSSCF